MLTLLVAGALTASWAFQGQRRVQGQREPVVPKRKLETIADKLARLPIAKVNAPEPIDPEEKFLRDIRNARHNSPLDSEKHVLTEKMEPILLDLPLSDQRPAPALPVTMSDAIVLGSVTEVRAFLSDDKTKIYSEARIQAEDILKELPSSELAPGSFLEAERSGGAIEFPSGKVLRRISLGRNIPQVGHRYLFFLTYHKDGRDFSILTAYEITADQICPLDGTADLEKGGHFPQFRNYEMYAGTPVSNFLAQVRAAIATQAVF